MHRTNMSAIILSDVLITIVLYARNAHQTSTQTRRPLNKHNAHGLKVLLSRYTISRPSVYCARSQSLTHSAVVPFKTGYELIRIIQTSRSIHKPCTSYVTTVFNPQHHHTEVQCTQLE